MEHALPDRRDQPRILMLTQRVPAPPDRGDRIRTHHVLRVLRAHFDLDVACTSAEPVDPAQRRTLESLAGRVAIAPLRPQWSALRAAGAVLGGQAITPA